MTLTQRALEGASAGMTGDIGYIKETVKSNFSRSRKGQFSGVDRLVPVAMSIVFLTILVGLGAYVLSEMNNEITNSNATNVLDKGLDALTEFGNWFVIIVIMAVVAVVMLILGFVRRAADASSRA